MKNTYLMLPLMMVLAGCSGIAPEAVRDESNTLTRPSFMKAKILDEADRQANQSDTVSEK
ncbi:hypothetical protein [Candidatus Bodocaedibacter vickermanii]|uniref:Lipoprotein n=1 Tax=Candidatus Bodocaedibacter vickermanii TaxID=2741701 RepID=A0A7L9RTY3_9PROT|nr:hypothetical protein CPBP_00756 [Candidatus Paracaedibacteraceae bacterium 'Lake Konstanz']